MSHRLLGMAKVNVRVSKLSDALQFFEQALGGERLHDRGSDTIGEFDGATMRVGDVVLDFIAPNTSDGALAKSIEKRGQGIDSLAFRVENLDDTAAALSELGIELVNRTEYHGTRIGFIHPRAAFGMLIELIESGE